MDGVDMVTVATLGQTVVLAITLIVFIVQLRSQTRAIKDAAYQGVLNDYTDIVRTLIDRPEIAELMDDLRRTDPAVESQVPPIPPEKRIVRSYLLLLYGLFERVYILRDKKWIDEASWQEWVAWIEVMCRNPLFAHVHTMTRGMFDAGFQDYVSGALARSSKTRDGGESPSSKPGD